MAVAVGVAAAAAVPAGVLAATTAGAVASAGGRAGLGAGAAAGAAAVGVAAGVAGAGSRSRLKDQLSKLLDPSHSREVVVRLAKALPLVRRHPPSSWESEYPPLSRRVSCKGFPDISPCTRVSRRVPR